MDKAQARKLIQRIITELKNIQREMELTDVDMCNFLCCDSESEYNEIMRMERPPRIFNLIMFICSVRRPLYSI